MNTSHPLSVFVSFGREEYCTFLTDQRYLIADVSLILRALSVPEVIRNRLYALLCAPHRFDEGLSFADDGANVRLHVSIPNPYIDTGLSTARESVQTLLQK